MACSWLYQPRGNLTQEFARLARNKGTMPEATPGTCSALLVIRNKKLKDRVGRTLEASRL
jgi:hypothetical protein